MLGPSSEGIKSSCYFPLWSVKLLATWQNPYEVIHWTGPVTYEVHQLDCRKKREVYHLNLLKPWHVQKGLLISSYSTEPKLGPQAP